MRQTDRQRDGLINRIDAHTMSSYAQYEGAHARSLIQTAYIAQPVLVKAISGGALTLLKANELETV